MEGVGVRYLVRGNSTSKLSHGPSDVTFAKAPQTGPITAGEYMAKQCLIEKQAVLAEKFRRYQAELAKIEELPKEKRAEALAELEARRIKNRLFKTRMYNRCAITGRAHGYSRFFGVCRHVLREKAHKGELPGVVKSSW